MAEYKKSTVGNTQYKKLGRKWWIWAN